MEDLYPPSPSGIPPPTLTPAYRLRVVCVLCSLLFFVAFYLALVVASGWLVVALATIDPEGGRANFAVWLAVLGAAMLFVFFFKGLFKRSAADTSHYVVVEERAQPELFSFVRRLCAEAGSPFPRRIYLSPDVNAAVFYPRSLLSLVWPVRKNLLIGLGLVNSVNLSEFKAALAHEFGHFAQSSMKLGQYVYVANQAIHDMVYARDRWDDWLAQWRRVDLRISFPAYAITAVVWVLRHLLAALYRVINLANLSLSRQMEFNADLHAVRLAGSDAIASTLWRVERGAIAFQQALGDLGSLAQHGRFSEDVYVHQEHALARLDGVLAKQDDSPYVRSLKKPYRPGKDLHFEPGDDHASRMWLTHPPNREREENAKRDYVAAQEVETSAWELFRDAPGLRARLSLRAYADLIGVRPKKSALLPAAEVEELIREESQEVEQAGHYHGLYEDRFVEPGPLDEEAAAADALSDQEAAETRAVVARWRGDELKELGERRCRILAEWNLLTAAMDGHLPRNMRKIEFRGREIPAADAAKVRGQVRKERDAMFGEIEALDRAVFRHFVRAAGPRRDELLARYGFLVRVQDLLRARLTAEAEVGPSLELLQQGGELDESTFGRVHEVLGAATATLRQVVKQAESIPLPKLSHMEEGAPASSFLVDGTVVRPLQRGAISGEWLNRMLQQFQEVLGRLRKLHYKNLGALLSLQEEIDPELYA